MRVNRANQRLSFCFVSETSRIAHPILDPSTRYRCFHPAELLVNQGHDCTIISGAQFHENPGVHSNVYVFHRPSIARPGFARLIKTLRSFGAVLIADYDDLVFGTDETALVSSAVRNGNLSADKAISIFHNNLEALNCFDVVTVSTEPLAAQVREHNRNARVHVLPNFIPGSLLSPQETSGTAWIKRPRHAIGYFAGTRSHDHDLPIVESVLHRVLSENPASSLLIVGPVKVPPGVASLPNVLTTPAIDYLHLPAVMTACTTVIAPLEFSTFNQCKSRVKFLEAALTGCRLVATPIPDMQQVGAEHLVLASTQDDWYTALSEVPSPQDLMKSIERNLKFLDASMNVNPLWDAVESK